MKKLLHDNLAVRMVACVRFYIAVLLYLLIASASSACIACAVETDAMGSTVRSPAVPWDGTVAESFAGGDGSEESPFIIETAGQLAFLARTVNTTPKYLYGLYYELASDIDLGGREWEPIGTGNRHFIESHGSRPPLLWGWFGGIFNGNGYTVRNFKLSEISLPPGEQPGTVYARLGLFGRVGCEYDLNKTPKPALTVSIRDLNVADFHITIPPADYKRSLTIGGLAGSLQWTSVLRCGVRGTIEVEGAGDAVSAGMLAAYASNSTVWDCSTEGTVTIRGQGGEEPGEITAGGLIGENRLHLAETSRYRPEEVPVEFSYGKIVRCETTVHMDIESGGGSAGIGGLIAVSYGAVYDSEANGSVRASVKTGDTSLSKTRRAISITAGGLIGRAEFEIGNCRATGQVDVDVENKDGGAKIAAGGLIGQIKSYYFAANRASGDVTVSGKTGTGTDNLEIKVGGLAGDSAAAAEDGIASGAVTVATDSAAGRIAIHAGGLFGVGKGKNQYCSASGNVAATSAMADSNPYRAKTTLHVGGLMGEAHGSIFSCAATGEVSVATRVSNTPQTVWAGGLAGLNRAGIDTCHAMGTVQVEARSFAGRVLACAGGLTGANVPLHATKWDYDKKGARVVKSYFGGNVSVKSDAQVGVQLMKGGVTGMNQAGAEAIQDCFWLLGSGDTTASAGIALNINYENEPVSYDVTHVQPLDMSAFGEKRNFTDRGWDFERAWDFAHGENGRFPVLRAKPADVVLARERNGETLLPVPVQLIRRPDFYRTATPDQVRQLLGDISLDGVSVHENKYTALTPLMLAARATPYPEVIDILVTAGCDVNAFAQPPWQKTDPLSASNMERSPVHFAVQNRNPDVLARLLSYKPDVSVVTGSYREFTPLHAAAEQAWGADHFIMLLEAGVDPHLAHPDPNYNSFGNPGLELWKKFTGQGGFFDSSRDSWREPADVARMTKALLAAGSLPNTEVLERMLRTGENEAALLLLEAGVNPTGSGILEAAFSRPDGMNREREVPDPDPGLVSVLIAHNDVNARFRTAGELTPLRAACRAAMPVEVVRLLVEAGAELDPTGWTAPNDMPGLVPAQMPGFVPSNILIKDVVESKNNNPELVAYLLDLGLSSCTYLDWQTLELAAKSRWPKPEAARALVKAGANPLWLKRDMFTRDFALSAGILDHDDNPLIQGEKTAGTRARLDFERQLVLEWARRYPKSAVKDRRFYAYATPDEVWDVVRRVSPRDGYRPGIKQTRSGRRQGHLFSMSTSSLVEAALVTPYPEVIDVLVEAGHDLSDKAVMRSFDNVNPEVTLAVLRRIDIPSRLAVSLSWCGSVHPSLLPILREAGLDLNMGRPSKSPFRESESSLIVEAVRNGNEPFARALLHAGVDLDRDDREGRRALDYALRRGYYDFALELLDAGAECCYRDADGRTLLEKESRHRESVPSRQRDTHQRILERLQDICTSS